MVEGDGMKNLIWTEKYRPKNLDEFIGDRTKVKELIKEPLAMPNFLLVSRSPGTGKTSLGYVIKNEIGCPDSDFLILNSSDDRKIETIRTTVKDFAITMRRKKSVPRLILMDEGDGMMSTAQNALRFLMEKYSSNCKFIITANDENKIIEPIRSRCVVMRMRELDKKSIMERLTEIVLAESVKYDSLALEKIIGMHYPDMRQMINHCQELSPDISLERVRTKTELESQFYSLLQQREPYKMRKFVIENRLEPDELLKYIIERTLEEHEEEIDKVKDMVIFAAEIAYRMKMGADSEIQLQAFCFKYMDIWK